MVIGRGERVQAGSDANGDDRPLLGVVASVALLLALIVPFGVYKLSKTEPYPAVIFPGGAGLTVRVRDGIADLVFLRLVAVDAAGNEVAVSPAALIEPIQPSNVYALVDNTFGQTQRATRRIRVSLVGRTLNMPIHVASSSERAEARRWLADRLEAIGAPNDALIIRWVRVAVDYENGQIIDETTVDEEVIRLD